MVCASHCEMKGVVLLLAVAATEAQPEQSKPEPEQPRREAGKKAELDDGKKGFFCTSDWDCSLNGDCGPASECYCHKSWVGEDCNRLNVLPVQKPAHAGAPGLAYGRVPTASQSGLASWGGSIVKDADGLYHLFAAEMSLDCGLTVCNPALRSRCQSAALY